MGNFAVNMVLGALPHTRSRKDARYSGCVFNCIPPQKLTTRLSISAAAKLCGTDGNPYRDDYNQGPVEKMCYCDIECLYEGYGGAEVWVYESMFSPDGNRKQIPPIYVGSRGWTRLGTYGNGSIITRRLTAPALGYTSGGAYYSDTTVMVMFAAIVGGEAAYSEKMFLCCDYEGNIYNTVKIGGIWWQRENNRCRYYSNGEKLTDSGDSAGYRDDLEHTEFGLAYRGRYYDGSAALRGKNDSQSQGIAQTGWHIPSNDEWQSAFSAYESLPYRFCAGDSDDMIWSESSVENSPGDYSNERNGSGFSAYPAGFIFKEANPPSSSQERISAVFVSRNPSSFRGYAGMTNTSGTAEVSTWPRDGVYKSVRCVCDYDLDDEFSMP